MDGCVHGKLGDEGTGIPLASVFALTAGCRTVQKVRKIQ